MQDKKRGHKIPESFSLNGDEVSITKFSSVPEKKREKDPFPIVQNIIDIFKDLRSFEEEGTTDVIRKSLRLQLKHYSDSLLKLLKENPELGLKKNEDGRTPAQALLNLYKSLGYLQASYQDELDSEFLLEATLRSTFVEADRIQPTIRFRAFEAIAGANPDAINKLRIDLSCTPETLQAIQDYEPIKGKPWASSLNPAPRIAAEIKKRRALTDNSIENELSYNPSNTI